ncbi:MAG TPA: SCO family protein [Thermoanaerobaculia bacterium]|nr:SCO family protein [Thermoanaerobaculia bacterium]
MRHPARRAATAWAAATVLVLTAAAGAAAPQKESPPDVPPPAERSPAAREQARSYFTDVRLVDQHGRSHRLYSDLMDRRVVVIDSMFTTCAAVCPVLGQKMKKIQEAAGERLGEDVVLLSITVDPEHDTPAEMAAYAKRFEARDGWYFLSGEPQSVRLALSKLGYEVEDKDAHSTIVLMGNERTGLWKKANGLSSAGELVEIFESVLQDGGPAPGQGAGR